MFNYKDEQKLYKDGKRNPSGYRMHRFPLKIRIAFLLSVIFIIGCFAMSLLEKLDIYSWNQLKTDTGIIDGAEITDSDFSVYYLDVGQSDCTIIISDDSVMMIDTGTANRINEIRSSLMTLDIKTIDYLVITHQHDDHMGCAAEIMRSYDVKNIIMPKLSEINMVTTRAYEELLTTIEEKGVNAISAKTGYSFSFGGSTAEIFSPSKQDKELNNMSVVLKVTFGETSFLFQGDAESKIENALLKSDFDLKADVLKVGHHGSNTSSTQKYLQAVSPKLAIISYGSDNSYGHPHEDVLKRLESLDISVYSTASNGIITVTSDGKNISVKTER